MTVTREQALADIERSLAQRGTAVDKGKPAVEHAPRPTIGAGQFLVPVTTNGAWEFPRAPIPTSR